MINGSWERAIPVGGNRRRVLANTSEAVALRNAPQDMWRDPEKPRLTLACRNLKDLTYQPYRASGPAERRMP